MTESSSASAPRDLEATTRRALERATTYLAPKPPASMYREAHEALSDLVAALEAAEERAETAARMHSLEIDARMEANTRAHDAEAERDAAVERARIAVEALKRWLTAEEADDAAVGDLTSAAPAQDAAERQRSTAEAVKATREFAADALAALENE